MYLAQFTLKKRENPLLGNVVTTEKTPNPFYHFCTIIKLGSNGLFWPIIIKDSLVL